MKKEEINKYSYSVLGAGRSGIGIAKLLKKTGAEVFISESLTKEKLMYFDENSLKDLDIPFELGENSEKIYENDIIIKSPGIPIGSELIQKAFKKGKKVYSEIEVAYWLCPCPIIAITGTNGKTTTTALTGEIFGNAGYDVKVCGNIGLAFSEVVDSLTDKSIVVLEVSSFQLESTKEFKPTVSMFLNFTPDHIDWHGSLENYFNAKLKINSRQKDSDMIVYNFDDIKIKTNAHKFYGKAFPFSVNENLDEYNLKCGIFLENDKIIYFDNLKNERDTIIDSSDIFIRGKHNLQNSMCAVSAAKYFDISNDVIKNTLKSFKGVEHRIEPVLEINGIKFFNDSKATNYDSLYVALESFPGNINLIIGGKKGDNNFALVKDFINNRVKKIFAIGDSKEAISKYFSEFKQVIVCKTLEEAVMKSYENSISGDIILFSPGYKSFDMFKNFEHRGEEFKKFVNAIKTVE